MPTAARQFQEPDEHQTGEYLTQKLGVGAGQDAETGAIRWDAVHEGTSRMLERQLQQVLLQIHETNGQI